jgi:hypothetical protein
VILLWPMLLVGAVYAARRSPHTGRGLRWFAAWALAGALFLFSLATGFSIGLFVLPLAGAALVWAAWRAPRWRTASGFVLGCGAIVALLVAINL